MSFTATKAFELLGQARDAGRLAHAYLITGPEGSGKRKLAARLIRLVNSLPDADGSADGLEALRGSTTTIVRPESKSRRITVNAIRAAEHTVQMAAPAGITKFLVIDGCDRMGPSAENAFLKTLEEPPRASMCLLLSGHPEQLLPTILSRCIQIQLQGASGPAELSESARCLLDAMKAHAESGAGGVSGALSLRARFSEILREAKTAIEDRNNAARKAETERYGKTTEGDWLKQREEFYKGLTESEYLETRNRLIEYLITWFGDALRQQNDGQHLDLPGYAETTGAMAEQISSREIGRKIEAVESLRSHLNTNVNEAIALETAFIRAFG